MTIILALYQLALMALLPLALAYSAVRALTDARYRTGWGQRFGLTGGIASADERGTIWVHGASMGELRAAAPLVRALKIRGAPLSLTATTEAGVAEAHNLLGARSNVRYLPIDLIPCLLLAFSAIKPRALVIVETELWPGLLWLARVKRVPVYLVTARLSDRSFPRYMKARFVIRRMLDRIEMIHAQSPEDARRFISLGAPSEKVLVGGNMKYDLPAADSADNIASSVRRAAADGWKVFVAGSVHPGEAGQVARAAFEVSKGGIKLGMIFAPRHLEKVEMIAAELMEAGLKEPVRWSQLEEPLEGAILEAFRAGAPLLVDQFGLLGSLYGGALAGFVGGSLVEIGGHNPLEPLNWGVPVLFGPHLQNAAHVREEITARELGREVRDSGELAQTLSEYLNDEELRHEVSERAAELFRTNRGALALTMKMLEERGVLTGFDGGES